MRSVMTIIVTIFVASSGYAATAKCKVTELGQASSDEKSVEIISPDPSGQLHVFGNFSLKVEAEPNGVPSIVLIDSKRGALASSQINTETGEGQVEVGFVDQNWRFHVTGTASCKLH